MIYRFVTIQRRTPKKTYDPDMAATSTQATVIPIIHNLLGLRPETTAKYNNPHFDGKVLI